MNIYQRNPARRYVLNPFGYEIFGNDEARDEAARRILNRFDETGLPFALYLSRWDMGVIFGDEAAWMAHGDELNAPEPLHDKWARYLIELGIPLIMVRETRGLQRDLAWAPAIILGNGIWQRDVRRYIDMADMILVNFGFFPGEGMADELQLIQQSGKEQCTVVLLPVVGGIPPGLLEEKRHLESLRGFDRVATTIELPPNEIMTSPLTADIVMRIIAIMNVPDDRRRDLRDAASRLSVFSTPSKPGVDSMAAVGLKHARTFKQMGMLDEAASFLNVAEDLASQAEEHAILREIASEREMNVNDVPILEGTGMAARAR